MTENQTRHVVIHGRVQGVGYRAWTRHQAELHDVRGWVRNRRDGTVEAVFSGSESNLDALLKACRQGPRGAVVERIETVEDSRETNGSFDGFKVRETL